VCHVVSLLIECEANINKLGFVPQNLAIDFQTLELLYEDQKDLFQQEKQGIDKYPNETYSHLVRKPLTKYLEEAKHIKQHLREGLSVSETANNSQRSKPYWTCIPEHQKISEHLKEKQKIICYLQNLRNLCYFTKTQQQAILPDIPLLHRIAPKIHSVVKTWKIASKPDIVQAPQDWKESLRKP
jgi:hypothetical protein